MFGDFRAISPKKSKGLDHSSLRAWVIPAKAMAAAVAAITTGRLARAVISCAASKGVSIAIGRYIRCSKIVCFKGEILEVGARIRKNQSMMIQL